MTVNRRGKRGTRAGHMIPESRNRRVTRNGRINKIARGTEDDRPTRKGTSREEWVIHCVQRAIGTRKNLITADDIASDILLELLNAGGFTWDEAEIEEFCRKRTTAMALRCLHRREIPECDFATVDEKGHAPSIADIVGHAPAGQHTHAEALEACALVRAIPDQQRRALEILCDGGNPLDVAEELEITPWAAIALIKEGRDYVHRVDPLNR